MMQAPPRSARDGARSSSPLRVPRARAPQAARAQRDVNRLLPRPGELGNGRHDEIAVAGLISLRAASSHSPVEFRKPRPYQRSPHT